MSNINRKIAKASPFIVLLQVCLVPVLFYDLTDKRITDMAAKHQTASHLTGLFGDEFT